VDGYCPLAAYLGSHGYCLELALRPGVQHSAKETEYNLECVVPMAQRLSAAGPKAPILVRKDAGFDSLELMGGVEAFNKAGTPQVDFLIKWNPRGTDVAEIAARLDADPATGWEHPREGKRVTLWEHKVVVSGIERPVRRVLRLIERRIDKKGQLLIAPEFELDGWTTTLPAAQFDAQQIIALYADHGTHEQFHSEFKTDLDLERLPSGKFATNYLVCQLAALAMNILRLIGQRGLLGPDAPVRHPAKRRRIKTVIQELIYRAGRLIEHGRSVVLGLGANDRAAGVFMRMYARYAPAP
jgi:DDE family transposase